MVAGRIEPRPRRNRRSFLRLTATSRAGATRHQFVSMIQALPASPFVRCSLSPHRRQRAPEQEVPPAAPIRLMRPRSSSPRRFTSTTSTSRGTKIRSAPRGGTATPFQLSGGRAPRHPNPSPRRNVSVLALIPRCRAALRLGTRCRCGGFSPRRSRGDALRHQAHPRHRAHRRCWRTRFTDWGDALMLNCSNRSRWSSR